MDKSFNDQELSDIMKEIEALEEDFKQAPVEHEEVLSDLVEMKTEDAIPLRPAHQAWSAPEKSSGTSMSFKVQGDINLDLQFDVGGKCISLTVSESGLSIQMEGGMTFHVPMSEGTSHKKVA